MKRLLLFFTVLSLTSISFSQNLQVFETFDEFQTAVTNNCSNTELTFEGFDNGVLQNLCNVPVLPDPNQQCFSSNEFEAGFSIQGLSQTNLAVLEQGLWGGIPINAVGPNSISETVLTNFNPSVNAVSFSTWEFVEGLGYTHQVEVYGESDQLLGSYTIDSSSRGLYGFHVISDEPITRIETKSNSEFFSTAGVFIGGLYFGASNCTTPILIPDPIFEQLLISLGYDDTLDGAVAKENIDTVTTLDISSLDISDLKGIEAFTALENFTSANNLLTTLDLSNNINLDQVFVNNNGQLTTLNLKNGNNRSSNTVMTLSTLDATNNANLQCIQVDNVTDAQNNPNWEKDASAVYSEDCALTLSTNPIDVSSLISIYPNPVKDVLTIDYLKTINSVEVYSLEGKLVFKNNEQNTSISLNSLASGIYLLKINTDLGQVVKKIIKE